MNVENAVYPGPEQLQAFFGAPEDGPFVMVNLLKFKRDNGAFDIKSFEYASRLWTVVLEISGPWP